MKKIIELAERYIHEGDSCPLQEALIKYKELQSTPITEEWLKEHGWEDCDTDEVGNHHWYYLEHRTYGIEIPIFCTKEGRWYVRGWDLRITNLAQLLDALELCGITMKED